MSRADERRRADALKAAKARDLIHATVPYAINAMTDEQIDQVQRVLDAAVVNPDGANSLGGKRLARMSSVVFTQRCQYRSRATFHGSGLLMGKTGAKFGVRGCVAVRAGT